MAHSGWMSLCGWGSEGSGRVGYLPGFLRNALSSHSPCLGMGSGRSATGLVSGATGRGRELALLLCLLLS